MAFLTATDALNAILRFRGPRESRATAAAGVFVDLGFWVLGFFARGAELAL